MSDHLTNLGSLARAGYPNTSGDMDGSDVCDGVTWMADEIGRLRACLSERDDLNLDYEAEIGRLREIISAYEEMGRPEPGSLRRAMEKRRLKIKPKDGEWKAAATLTTQTSCT